MFVKNLSMRDFRNYARLDLQPSPGVTLLYGPNAAGKTSVLEAIFYLATLRSPRVSAARDGSTPTEVQAIDVPAGSASTPIRVSLASLEEVAVARSVRRRASSRGRSSLTLG